MMVPIIAVSLFAGQTAVICFFAIISIVAFTEYARATGLHRELTMTFISLAGIIGIAAEPRNHSRCQYASAVGRSSLAFGGVVAAVRTRLRRM
jgi:hypothetical protein